MYSDSKVIYREYIQNACDQIDLANKLGILSADEGSVDIFIDSKKRYISIKDNATGVKAEDFIKDVGDIANSNKKIGENKLSGDIHSSYAKHKDKETVLDILEDHITKIYMSLFDINSGELERKADLKLYPLKTEHDYLAERLIEYLDCYTGDRNFNILVSYSSGLPDILLVL